MARSTTTTQQYASAQQPNAHGHAGPQGVEVDAYGRPIDPSQRWSPQGGHYQQPQQPQQPGGYGQHDPHAQPGGHYGYGHQPAYGEQQQPAGGYPGQPAYAEPHYQPHEYPTAPPHAHGADPYAAQQGYPQHPASQAAHQQGYAGDPYAQHPASHGAAPQAGHFEAYNPAQPHGGGYDRFDTQLHVDPQAAQHPQFDPRRFDPHGHLQAAPAAAGYGVPYGQQAEPQGHYDPASYPGHGQQQGDPRSWDLSQYPPPGAQLGHPGQHGYPGAEAQHGAHQDPRWADPAAPAWPQPGHPSYGDQHYDPMQPHGQQPGYGHPGQGAGLAHDAGYDAHAADGQLAEDDVETPRRPRALLVIGALVGAIALGGGLAYGYKKFVSTAGDGATPIVKADKSPTRVKPTEPTGKQQPHTDKKIFANRLDEKGGAPASVTSPPTAPAAPTDADAPRKVQTVIVNRDGSLTPTAPPAQAAAPAPAAGPAPAVPGMVVEGLTPRPELRGPAAQDRVVPAATPVTPVQKAAPAQPKVVDLPLPKVKPEAPQAAAAPPVRKKPAVRDDLAAPQQQVAAAPGAAPAPAAKLPGANGYVAVLTSRKSREDALKSFADLHQKYGEVLGNRPTDVREVNLGDKGIWYRSIVGPPGSKEAAMALCKQLKDQGFTGCFMMAY